MKVLFVCTGNSFRSPVAEALLKSLRSDITVDSAGISPASAIAPNAQRLLEEENAAQYLKATPEGIDQNELGDFHLVVAMKEEHKRHLLARHPQLSERIIVWDIDDPLFLPEGYDRKIMEEIKEKVSELSASL